MRSSDVALIVRLGTMFGGQRSVQHPQLGSLTRSRGAWRGQVRLPDGVAVPLSIMGSRKDPAPEGLALARTIEGRFDVWRPSIETALFEHATDAGLVVDEVPAPSFVAVFALEDVPAIEFGFEVSWDDDHTIGVCIRDDVVVEVNGSVLEP